METYCFNSLLQSGQTATDVVKGVNCKESGRDSDIVKSSDGAYCLSFSDSDEEVEGSEFCTKDFVGKILNSRA